MLVNLENLGSKRNRVRDRV